MFPFPFSGPHPCKCPPACAVVSHTRIIQIDEFTVPLKWKPVVLTLPAIALQIPVPPVVWRADSGFRHAATTSAADVIRYEQDELGNPLGITAALILELENYSAASLVWVTLKRHDAARYGKPERVKIDGQAYVIAEDGDGGFLILFCDDPASFETEGQTMSKPADDIKADAATQAEAAAKHEQERELAASKGEALPGDPATAPAQTMEPEDEKKKGGAVAEADPGITPLMSELSLNIRPDIARGPGGDYLVTTVKNSTVDRDAVEALAAMDKANALEDAFEKHIRDGATMSADYAAHLAGLGMIDDKGDMKAHYFEHMDAGGFLDDDRAAFYAEHGKPEQEASPRLEITHASDDSISLHTTRDEAVFDLSIGLDAAGVSVSFANGEAEQKTARFSFDDYKDVDAYPDPEGEARANPATPKLEIKQPDIESAMFAQHVERYALDYVHIDIEREGGAFGLTIGLHEDRIGVLFSKGAAGEIERFSFDEGRAEEVTARQNASSAKEQEAELVASTGAAPQQADDKSGMSYEERIEARAEESRQRHAAEAEAAPEREQEVSMGRGE